MLLQDQHITMQRGPAGQNHAEMPSRLLRFSNVVSYLVFILINTLANQGVFGPTNAEVRNPQCSCWQSGCGTHGLDLPGTAKRLLAAALLLAGV